MTRRRILGAGIGVAVVLLSFARGAMAEIATFDSLAEGFYGETTFTDGGLLFYNADARTGPDRLASFAIDDVSHAFTSLPAFNSHFTSPNVFSMTAIGNGPSSGGFGRFGEVTISTGRIATSARIDIFHIDDVLSLGNSIILEAYSAGQMVAVDSVLLTTCCFQFDQLSIEGVSFDALRLTGVGPSQDGVFFGSIDNVNITPEPSLFSLGLIGALFIVLRRIGMSSKSRLLAVPICICIFTFVTVQPSLAQCAGAFSGSNSDQSDLYTSPGCSGGAEQRHNTHVFANLCPAKPNTTVTITVDAHGDLIGANRYYDVFLNDVGVTPVFVTTNDITTCAGTVYFNHDAISVPAVTFNQRLLADAEHDMNIVLFASCAVRQLCIPCCDCQSCGSQDQGEVTQVTLTYTKGCLSAADCNDGDACTTDVCNAGTCSNSPISCPGDGNPCTDDVCSGGLCYPNNSNPCTPDGNDCTMDVCSGGSCYPPHAAGTSCGSSSDTQCSNPDRCDGAGGCLPNHEPAGTPCGNNNDTACDNPDTCSNFGNCLNRSELNGTSCADAFFCNGAEQCQNGACPAASPACGTQPCCEANDSCGLPCAPVAANAVNYLFI